MIGSVQPGDVVGFDLNAEGGINHAGIVTKIEDGKIYYSGNTGSMRDRDLSKYPKEENYDYILFMSGTKHKDDRRDWVA